MVLAEADPGGDLLCRFYLAPGELTVSVGVTASHVAAAPDYDSFAWQVLTTLATHAASDTATAGLHRAPHHGAGARSEAGL